MNREDVPDPKCVICGKMFEECAAAWRANDLDALVRFLQTDHTHEHEYPTSTGNNPDPS